MVVIIKKPDAVELGEELVSSSQMGFEVLAHLDLTVVARGAWL